MQTFRNINQKYIQYYGEGCSDAYANYTGPFTAGFLVGCPLDSINRTAMAKPHVRIIQTHISYW
jgi:hypothetical protein